jgi:hypothetical protein
MRLHSTWARALVATFLVVLVAPGAGMLLGVDLQGPRAENRTLAPRPPLAWDWSTLRAWPEAATKYFEDHFAFRSRLVRWQAELRLAVHGTPSPDVFVGRDGWFFYAEDGAAQDYASQTPFAPDELELWRQTLQHTYDWLRRRGIAYVFVIAPDKHAVYPEFMPPAIARVRESRSEQLVAYLRAHTDVPVADLRPALLAAKGGDRLYHRTDTHWNDRGAFVGYQEIVRVLGRQLTIAPLGRDAFLPRTTRAPGMDLAGMMGLTQALEEEDLMFEPREPPRWRIAEPASADSRYMDWRIVTEHEDGRLPRAVVFRDSFGAALVPLLAQHFSRALYLWQYNFDPAVVAQEHAAVVIQEWVGRRLSTELPYDPLAGSPDNEDGHAAQGP